MDPSNKLLSDIVTFRTYSKHLPMFSRRETWEETVNRSMTMHLDKFPKLSKEILSAFSYVHDREVLGSMRGMQFNGAAVLKNNVRQYNCAFVAVNDTRVFGEILFTLLSGAGVGFSVQSRHISSLPRVLAPKEEGYYVVHDSIEGWAEALNTLVEAYFYRKIKPQFDFSMIRAKGELLVTTGARAPGSEPLKHMLEAVEAKFKMAIGRKLLDIEVHDIICMVSDCVLAGGIRRAALISLFDKTSTDMLKCKSGDWYLKHPYRARANNSAILLRSTTTKDEFMALYKSCQESGAGEPGFLWTNDLDMGCNPCNEVNLHDGQFCNLSSVNQTGVSDKADFLARVKAASFIGTLQASYTDFHYLRPLWKEVTEREALIGVSFTGIADSGDTVTDGWLREAAQLVLDTNERVAKKIGINKAARTTVLKPEGSSSATVGSSSGVHDRHDEFYLRRVRISEDDALAKYLRSVVPELCEEAKNEANTMVVTIPQKSPPGAKLRKNSSALELWSRVKRYNINWIAPGHRSGANHNNVSCTINVKDHEWESLGEVLWADRETYTGVSLLPYDGGNYVQAPFESCDESVFNKMNSYVKEIDLRQVIEESDQTTRSGTVACGGGACEIV
jgi:ribonucleoside-diphosphate reductase alpha chain